MRFWPEIHSSGLESKTMVMKETKAVLLLLQGECGNDVRVCHGPMVDRLVCHGCPGIVTHLSRLSAGLTLSGS